MLEATSKLSLSFRTGWFKHVASFVTICTQRLAAVYAVASHGEATRMSQEVRPPAPTLDEKGVPLQFDQKKKKKTADNDDDYHDYHTWTTDSSANSENKEEMF